MIPAVFLNAFFREHPPHPSSQTEARPSPGYCQRKQPSQTELQCPSPPRQSERAASEQHRFFHLPAYGKTGASGLLLIRAETGHCDFRMPVSLSQGLLQAAELPVQLCALRGSMCWNPETIALHPVPEPAGLHPGRPRKPEFTRAFSFSFSRIPQRKILLQSGIILSAPGFFCRLPAAGGKSVLEFGRWI